MNENNCNCYNRFMPGICATVESLNPLTCAKCHKIIDFVPYRIENTPKAPQVDNKLTLVPVEELLQELKNRFPHMIFMGKKFIDEKGMWMTSDTSQGDANICAGLGMEVAMKNVYFKLITQQQTDKF